MTQRTSNPALWRNRTFLTYFFTLSLLAIVFFGAAIWSITTNKGLTGQIEVERKRADGNAQQLLGREQLNAADALVIVEGRYADALEQYVIIRDGLDGPLAEALNARINALNELLNAQANDTPTTDPRDLMLAQYRNTIAELEARTGSVQQAMARLADSLQGRMEDLQAEMQRKEKELGKKEQVQVLSFSSMKGQKIHYLGEVRDGKANGGGVGIWTTGSVYRGQWRNNLRHGEGTFEWADGERYEGNYVDGVREGFGKYYWPSGDRYEGQWKGDRRNGQGTLFDMDGNVRFKGLWKEDKPGE